MTPEEAKQILAMFGSFPSTTQGRQMYMEALQVLEQSNDSLDRMRAQLYSNDLPGDAGDYAPATMVRLRDRFVHRIWVEGDVSARRDFSVGLLSQPNVPGWTNLLWVYRSMGPIRVYDIDGFPLVVRRRLYGFGHRVLEVDFRESVRRWDARPDWLTALVQYLDAMLPKKGYIAMGDIMRMVVLWIVGGVYVDVKIQFLGGAAKFFLRPRVSRDRLMCVSSGHGLENWAMISHRRCAMIATALQLTLDTRLPPLSVIAKMPVNWMYGAYSKAHKELHENKGVWPVLQAKLAHRIELFDHSLLTLRNPRPLNSWANDDGRDFDWT